jgi:hypothetical protein
MTEEEILMYESLALGVEKRSTTADMEFLLGVMSK